VDALKKDDDNFHHEMMERMAQAREHAPTSSAARMICALRPARISGRKVSGRFGNPKGVLA
jgi:hypothetical protein